MYGFFFHVSFLSCIQILVFNIYVILKYEKHSFAHLNIGKEIVT